MCRVAPAAVSFERGKLLPMAAPLSAASRVVASRNQVSTNVAGETVILGMGEGIYYGLDSVGTRIWALIQEPCTLGAVSATVETRVTGSVTATSGGFWNRRNWIAR